MIMPQIQKQLLRCGLQHVAEILRYMGHSFRFQFPIPIMISSHTAIRHIQPPHKPVITLQNQHAGFSLVKTVANLQFE